jgi:hypothetical protein
MNWKDRYKKDQLITSLNQLKVGDLIYYISINFPEEKRYCIINHIDYELKEIWGHWSDSIEEIKDEPNDGYMILPDPDVTIFKINGGNQNGLER